MLVVIADGVIVGLVLGIIRTIEQTIKLLTIVLGIYEFQWENCLAVLEVLILVCTSALPRGTLSTCRSDTPIMGSGHVRLYPLDTVPTMRYPLFQWMLLAQTLLIKRNSTVAVKNVCPFFVSGFWVFFQKFHYPFLHLNRAPEYLGDIYIDP